MRLMRRFAAACAVALVVLVPPPLSAEAPPDPSAVEAAFGDARLRDVLRGVLGDPAKQVRISVHVSGGSKVSARLVTDAGEGTPITGLAMDLCTAEGDLIDVSTWDRSTPGSGVVDWRNVAFAVAGEYVFVIRGASAGVWRLELRGTVAKSRQSVQSTADLASGGETEVAFDGLARSTLSFSLKRRGGSKFAGELVRVLFGEGDEEVAGVPVGASKGTIALEGNGAYRLVFRNAASRAGAWTAKTTVKPAKLYPRRGYVRTAGTAFVPFVKKVDPDEAFHRDTAATVVVTGRDFQPGVDVRLVRGNRPDILGEETQVRSETEVAVTFDLDTEARDGQTSTGDWTVGVWNAPEYDTPGDRRTLVEDSPTNDLSKTFTALTAASIRMPRGVVKATEVWFLDFNEQFATDLDRMGFQTSDPEVERKVRGAVEAYVALFLRDLFRLNETTGKVSRTASVPVSFVVDPPPPVAGTPGEDYNRIEIGGPWQSGDDRDASPEPLLWGYAPTDTGNAARDDLSVDVPDGLRGTIRVGHGARTRVLDPDDPAANADWIAAMRPLRDQPLTGADRVYFQPNFGPRTAAEANRYRDIVNQVTRASREIAAIVAHHIGRSMGLPTGGSGPMAAPSDSGYLWPTTRGLAFAGPDVETLRANVVPHELPGKSDKLVVTYFPLIATQPSLLPNLTTATDYAVSWGHVGGRPNAVAADFAVTYLGLVPSELAEKKYPKGLQTPDFEGIRGNVPLYRDTAQTQIYGGILYLRVDVADRLRGGTRSFPYRLNILPNVPMLRPGNEQLQGTNLRNAVLNTP